LLRRRTPRNDPGVQNYSCDNSYLIIITWANIDQVVTLQPAASNQQPVASIQQRKSGWVHLALFRKKE
jgi:hypothetical protein